MFELSWVNMIFAARIKTLGNSSERRKMFKGGLKIIYRSYRNSAVSDGYSLVQGIYNLNNFVKCEHYNN